MSMLETSYMRGERKFMSVNTMCAKQITKLANKDHTPRWLNWKSGALVLIPIEKYIEGWICVVLIYMTNNMELKFLH